MAPTGETSKVLSKTGKEAMSNFSSKSTTASSNGSSSLTIGLKAPVTLNRSRLRPMLMLMSVSLGRCRALCQGEVDLLVTVGVLGQGVFNRKSAPQLKFRFDPFSYVKVPLSPTCMERSCRKIETAGHVSIERQEASSHLATPGIPATKGICTKGGDRGKVICRKRVDVQMIWTKLSLLFGRRADSQSKARHPG